MPAEIDHVVDDLGAANQRIWQAVMQVSQYLAQHQQAALREAEISGTAHAKALRSTIEGERIASERIYSQALKPEFWNDATSKEAAHVYGLATRFSTVDPQAAMAARTCEREAAGRWNVDLAAPAPAQPAPMAEVRDVMPEVPGEFRDWYELRTKAAASAAHAIRGVQAGLPRAQQSNTHDSTREYQQAVHWHRETFPRAEHENVMREIHASDTGEPDRRMQEQLMARWKGARAEIMEVSRSHGPTVDKAPEKQASEKATWDSLEAREKWAQELRERGYTPEQTRAITTAEKSLSKPVAELLQESKNRGVVQSDRPARKQRIQRQQITR